jgi:uncharacterized protein (DUF2062 family)
MGIIPLWGFQLAIAIALSIWFRLNKALVIIAANISIPPMIPLIIFLSHLAGRPWMGDKAQVISFSKNITLGMIESSFLQYVVGAITLAIAAGVIFAAMTFLILKLFRRKRVSPS